MLRPCDSTPTAPPTTSTGCTAPRSSSPRTPTRPRTSSRTPTSRSSAAPASSRATPSCTTCAPRCAAATSTATARPRRRVSCVELDSAPEPRYREGEDPSLRAEQAEVLAAIRALPEIHRDVLVTTYVAGLTYTEAADALGCKRGTIMSRVFRAREALVKSLDGDKIAA